MSESFPRKYWWSVLIVVPIAVAIIGVLPEFGSEGGGGSSTTTFDLQGAQFEGEVTMVDTQVILEQVQEGPDSDELESLVLRAVNLSKTGFRNEAIELFLDLAERTESPEVFNNLGALYAMSGQTDEALAAYREGLAREPQSESLTVNLARLYAKQNRVQDALSVLDNAATNDNVQKLRTELTAMLDSGDTETEPNDDANNPTPISIGTTTAGLVSSDTDVDFYSFTVGALPRDWTKLRVRSSTPSLKPFVRLFAADKSEVWRSDDAAFQVTPGQDVERDFTLRPDERYFVAVSSLESTGRYTLDVTKLNLFDGFEPNDTGQSAARIDLGHRIDASILDRDDTDYYLIPNANSLAFVLTNESPSLKPHVAVFNADRQLIWQSEDTAYKVTAGRDVRGTIEPRGTKGLYVAVSSLEGRGDYELKLTD